MDAESVGVVDKIRQLKLRIVDQILDATDTTKYPSGSVFYLYTPNLDHLSNDAENFGGLMTEVHIN